MKVRFDFVTNSSSSSFTCDVCGYETSGMDMCLSDAEMVQCENGHTICEDHIDYDFESKETLMLAVQKKIDLYQKNANDPNCKDKDSYTKWANEEKELLQRLQNDEVDEDELYDLVRNYDLRYNLPASACPICQFNSLINYDGIRYLMKKYGTDSESVLKEIKEAFKDYKEFKKYIEGVE